MRQFRLKWYCIIKEILKVFFRIFFYVSINLIKGISELKVVHKEMIDKMSCNLLIYRLLNCNIQVMWIIGVFCGFLFGLSP